MMQGIIEAMSSILANTGEPAVKMHITRQQFELLREELNVMRSIIEDFDDNEEPTFLGMQILVVEDEGALPPVETLQ